MSEAMANAGVAQHLAKHAGRSLRESRSPRPLVLSINLAVQTLASAGLVAFVTDKLLQHNVEPQSLVSEITDSHAVASEENLRAPIVALRALGCAIAVDDFGTGFSTIGSPQLLEADYLKIDLSLIQGLPVDPLDRAVVSGLTAIARASGKRTVAECVENPRAPGVLLECGVDLAQGFAVGLPRTELPGAMGHGPGAVAARRDAG
jgi:EAL domain-containing protein (putative c-di-GMP-specific phosphodiesterase class I)